MTGKHPCFNGRQELEGISVKFDGTEGKSFMYIEDSNYGVMFRKTVGLEDAHMFLGNVEKVQFCLSHLWNLEIQICCYFFQRMFDFRN